MIDAKTIYDPADNDWCGYQPIVDAIGEPLVQVDEDSCQGDSFVLLKSRTDGRFGLLFFGWGSCSGCDALQACTNIDEVQDLVNSMERSVEWYLTLAGASDRIHSDIMKAKWQWSSSLWAAFCEKVDSYIKENEQCR